VNKNSHKIFIIVSTLLFFSFSTSIQCATLYRCVDANGSILMTDNIPTDPNYKCKIVDSYTDPTPEERSQQQRKNQGRGTIPQKSYPEKNIGLVPPSRVKVTVKRIGSNLYEDIFTHIVIKTAACVELALMDDALLDAPGGIGELYFLNTGMSCMVVKVYRK